MNPGLNHVLIALCVLVISACAPAGKTMPEEALPFNLVLEGGSVWKGWGSHPMFADIHSHAVRGSRANSGIFKHPDAENYIRQGVTTVIGGPDGSSDLSIARLLSDLESTPASVNFGTFIGHNTVRNAVMGRENRAPTDDEFEAMKSLVETAMLEGAYGLSSGLKYIPGAYSETEEVIELARVAGEYGGIYISHMREEGLDLIKSVQETIRISTQRVLNMCWLMA